MVNDDHNILLGLYRESTSCETKESSKDFTLKIIEFDGVFYSLTESRIGRKFIWQIYSEGEELSRDEILSLYALVNAKRQMKQ